MEEKYQASMEEKCLGSCSCSTGALEPRSDSSALAQPISSPAEIAEQR